MQVRCETTCVWRNRYFEAGEVYTVDQLKDGETMSRHLVPVEQQQPQVQEEDQPRPKARAKR